VDTGAVRDDVVSPNRFASLTDFDVEFEVIEWKLTDVAEISPLRVTVKPKATVPVKVSKTAKSYSLPLLAKTSEDEDASVTYGTPTPLSAIASDVREAIRQASNQQLDVQSDSAFFHATEARYALKNYADPSALVSEIRSEPLAHAFAFASEIQHDQYAFNSAIRLHTIHRCLAASDDDRVRQFMRRAASLPDVAAPFERGTIINKFQAISEQADEDCQRCLSLNDTLALFELLLMMLAPDFYFNDSLLTVYLKNSVMWLPATPERLLHPYTLLQTLSTSLGKYITNYISDVQRSNQCINQLTIMQGTDMASLLENPLLLLLRRTTAGVTLAVDSDPTQYAPRC
jgi:hypothetical protein